MEKLHEVERYYVLESDDLEKGELSPIVEQCRVLYKAMTDAYVRSRKAKLKIFNENLEANVRALFDALEWEFAKRCEIAPAN
jgi:hypothetical protein